MSDASPFAGALYMANLDPILGSEQAGIRPVIILSVDMMNLRSRRVIVCPITSNMQPWMTKIALPDGLKTRGMVLADQIRSIDKAARLLRFIEPTPANFVTLVRSYVGRLLDLEAAGTYG
ncbi:type II toxin-antitoxin system PemK/MazF family toxin [Rhizobium sp. 16-449-1b]|jgi:mRNA interferase MazF|nr:type II toxin-antitoxin system PemK/MazF family toxin [Rhizobium sp. 16-449-1b]